MQEMEDMVELDEGEDHLGGRILTVYDVLFILRSVVCNSHYRVDERSQKLYKHTFPCPRFQVSLALSMMIIIVFASMSAVVFTLW